MSTTATATGRKAGLGYGWFILFAAVLVAFLFVAIPVWLIQPFRAETPSGMQLSYTLRNWSPIVTVICFLTILALIIKSWKSIRWFSKLVLCFFTLLTLGLTWMARQNHFEWMFHPLPKPDFAKANEASFVDSKDMVMAISINGEAVAYPIRSMAYHHVVQSVIGGTPVTVTY